MRTFTGGTFVVAIFLALTGLAPSTAAADPVADFYRGKSISMVIATAPGGDYDLRARLVARHIGRHIPGNPAIVPRNMPGGVGIQAANYMANVAPQDGTVAARHHAEHVDLSGARRRRRRIRHPQVLLDRQHHRYARTRSISWHTTGIKTIQDAMARSSSSARPARRQLGLLSEGAERDRRHQVQDRDRLSGRQPGQPRHGARRGRRPHQLLGVVEGDQPHWLAEKKIFMLVQIALEARTPSLPTCRPRSSSPRPTRTRR